MFFKRMDYLEADETKNDTPILICRSYQKKLINKIKSIDLYEDEDLEYGDAVINCLDIVEKYVKEYTKHIRFNCLDAEENAAFIDELLTELEDTEYCCMMDDLRDYEEEERCKKKYKKIKIMIQNMFNDDEFDEEFDT